MGSGGARWGPGRRFHLGQSPRPRVQPGRRGLRCRHPQGRGCGPHLGEARPVLQPRVALLPGLATSAGRRAGPLRASVRTRPRSSRSQKGRLGGRASRPPTGRDQGRGCGAWTPGGAGGRAGAGACAAAGSAAGPRGWRGRPGGGRGPRCVGLPPRRAAVVRAGRRCLRLPGGAPTAPGLLWAGRLAGRPLPERRGDGGVRGRTGLRAAGPGAAAQGESGRGREPPAWRGRARLRDAKPVPCALAPACGRVAVRCRARQVGKARGAFALWTSQAAPLRFPTAGVN